MAVIPAVFQTRRLLRDCGVGETVGDGVGDSVSGSGHGAGSAGMTISGLLTTAQIKPTALASVKPSK